MSVRRVQFLRRRQQMRGATMFIVVLVITLLSALGMFAVRSAGLATLASGFDRQLTQTHYVTEYGIYTLVADVSNKPNVYYQQMVTTDPGKKTTSCVGHGQVLGATCMKVGLADLEQFVVQKHNPKNKVFRPSKVSGYKTVEAGSLGPRELEGDWKIELTDLHGLAWPVAGYDNTPGSGARPQFVIMTVSAEGMVRPKQQTKNKWDTASATAASIESSRAHVIFNVYK